MSMRAIRFLLVAGLLSLALAPGPARAGGVLTVRLVRVSRSAQGVDPALRDVADALSANFVFQGYQMVAQTSQPLPADGRMLRLGPYSVRSEGHQQSLAIRVEQGRRRLLQTTARLTGTRPLIVGGFPADDGDILVLVFAAR